MIEFEFTSAFDGRRLAGAFFPAKHPLAVLQIVHGMCEHKERYYPFMEYLAEYGIASVIEDHRGHGKSVDSPDDLGWFGKDGAEALLSDLHTVTGIARERCPGMPVFLLGHSMGALAVRALVREHGDGFRGLLVLGNPGDNPLAGFGRWVARRAQRRKGDHARSRFLTTATFTPFILRSGRLSSKNGWVCSDPNVVAEYDRDPLCGFEFYANGYEALMTLMIRANAPGAAVNPDLPVRFHSGAKDPCMGGIKKLNAAVERMRGEGYRDVEARTYPGLFHELLNETGKEEIWRELRQTIELWLTE